MLSAFFLLLAVVYTGWSLLYYQGDFVNRIEWVGSTALLFTSIMAALIAYYVQHVHRAQGGELPEDVLTDMAEVADVPVVVPARPEMSITQLQAFERHLLAAKRPMLILGGSCWSDEGCAAIADFAQRFQVPVATEFRRAGLFPANHTCYAGDLGFGQNPKLSQRVRDADLLILLGARMAEVPSNGYSLIKDQAIVHVFPDAVSNPMSFM